VPGHYEADIIPALPQPIDSPIELDARNAEDIGYAFFHELTSERCSAGLLHD
jgi:hypothetical protein